VGHKILCAVYHIIKNKEPYKELGSEFLEQRKLNNRLKSVTKQLNELGFEVELKELKKTLRK